MVFCAFTIVYFEPIYSYWICNDKLQTSILETEEAPSYMGPPSHYNQSKKFKVFVVLANPFSLMNNHNYYSFLPEVLKHKKFPHTLHIFHHTWASSVRLNSKMNSLSPSERVTDLWFFLPPQTSWWPTFIRKHVLKTHYEWVIVV